MWFESAINHCAVAACPMFKWSSLLRLNNSLSYSDDSEYHWYLCRYSSAPVTMRMQIWWLHASAPTFSNELYSRTLLTPVASQRSCSRIQNVQSVYYVCCLCWCGCLFRRGWLLIYCGKEPSERAEVETSALDCTVWICYELLNYCQRDVVGWLENSYRTRHLRLFDYYILIVGNISIHCHFD